MRSRPVAYFTALAAVAVLLTGCSSAVSGGSSSPGKASQLRLVTSSAVGTCSAPALTVDGPASACDRAGTTTYKLSKSLGEITPTSATIPKDQGAARSVNLEFDKADSGTFGIVSREAVNKHLAILLDGRVLAAPLVMAPITTGVVTLAFGSASMAQQIAVELNASAAS